MNELLQFLMNPPPAPSLEGISLAILPAVMLGFKFGLPLAIGALRGAFGGGSSQSQESTQQGTIQDQRFTNNFFSDPQAQQFNQGLFGQFNDFLGQDQSINKQAINDFRLSEAGRVNRDFEGAQRGVQAMLASRGTGFSSGPQGVAFGQLGAERGAALSRAGGAISRFEAFELPQIQEAERLRRLQAASQLASFQPRSQTTDSTRTLNLTTTGQKQGQQGNIFNNALQGAVGELPFDIFNSGGNPISNIPINIPNLSQQPFNPDLSPLPPSRF